MGNQVHIGLLRISLFCVALFAHIPNGMAQRNFRIQVGGGVNQVFSNKANASDLKNEGQGRVAYTVDIDGTFTFSKHFGVSLSYMKFKNNLFVRFEDVEVVSFDYKSTIGYITFDDNLYLYGNQIGINFNYENPFKKNNIVFSLGINRAYYNSKQNYVDRHYESVPANSSFSNIEARQSSPLSGPKITALNASLMYERLIYKDKFGLSAKVNFIYNFISSSYQYTHSDMDWENRYHYTFGTGTISSMRYYRLSYNTLNFTLGVFYKLNIGKHEDR